MKYQQSWSVADPASEPLTLKEAKNQCEIAEGDTSRDAELSDRIASARGVVEHDTQRLLISRTVTEKCGEWPCDDYPDGRESYRFYWGTVSAITSVTYRDTANDSQTISSANYSLDASNQRLVFASTYSLPALYDRWDAITVTYTAGYGTTPYAIPAELKQLLRLRVQCEFERGQDSRLADKLEDAYENLLRRFLRSTYP